MNVAGYDELDRLAARFAEAAEGGAQRRYTRAVRSVASEVEAELRQAVLGVRVTSRRGGRRVTSDRHNLRRRVSGAVGHRNTRAGIRFVVQADQVDEKYGASLPRYLDGELQGWRRWRHPVFGDPEVWVQQTGMPWFFTTIRRKGPRIESAIKRAMSDVADDIQG